MGDIFINIYIYIYIGEDSRSVHVDISGFIAGWILINSILYFGKEG